MSTFQQLLEKPDGSQESFLRGYEHTTWDEKNQHDLVSLASDYGNKDALSKFIDKLVREVYHKHLGHRLHDPVSALEAFGNDQPGSMFYYSDRKITTTIDALTTILSSALPALSAFGLFFIEDPLAKLLAIVACTFLFSSVVTLVAKATRAECFGATAAFAAVLVVFVSNGVGCQC